MKLSELQKGEKFIFKGHTYTKQKAVPYHSKKFEHDIFDCLDEHYRHRPFRDDTEVEPCQRRITIP